jgi:NAD(P)-dependent dehydrogenase (short-subunit alcohol dehydrogenase family)
MGGFAAAESFLGWSRTRRRTVPLGKNFSKQEDVVKAADYILETHGRIDLLVSSAGVNLPRRSWVDMDLDGWNQIVGRF